MKTFDVNNIQLTIQSPGIDVSENLREFLIQQIEKLGKLNPRMKKCEIILHNEKNDKLKNCVLEAKIFVPENMFFSKSQDVSYQLAARKVFEDLHEQLFKLKESLEEH